MDLNRHLLETILEHSPAVIYAKRKDGRYLYINREWENACNMERETVLGRTDFELFPEDLAQQFRTNDLAAMEAGRMTESEERLDTPLGEQVFLSRKVPLTSSGDEVEGTCGISTNITDRRRAALALQEANTMLHQRTHELAKSLEDLRTAQNRLIQTEKLAALGRLVAGVAHELNSPIGISITVASTLARRCASFTEQIFSGPVQRSVLAEFTNGCCDAANQLVVNLQRAGELIQSFKQVAIDRSLADRRSFNLKLATEQLVASVRPGLPRHRDSLALELPSDIVMDSYPGAYGQVLTNLIFNAVTHGFADSPGGHVLIKARRLGMEWVEITFSDDGGGIPEEVQRHVFDPFFTTRRAQGSTGLGLYIVHNLVTEQLGGRITLVSAPEKGTTICMTLPLHAPGESEQTSAAASKT
jgi:PAS domain S-box-containing protein